MLTRDEFEYMLANPGAPMRNKSGSCEIRYHSGDRLFVMRGPTGTHTLFAGATDLDRLNAHWAVFGTN